MIAFIKGTIFEKGEGFCVVENGGIGYEIFLPQRSIEKFSLKGEVFLYCFQRVKEDQNDLFGFETKEEKLFFEQLISVSGVGPKTALLILEFSPEHIKKAIEEEDIKFLSQTKGMGKKTVSRLILELKGKLPNLDQLSNTSTTSQRNTEENSPEKQKSNTCISALEGLGFQKKAIQELFTNNKEKIENLSEEKIIKWALQEL